jgi:hypothetical protein
MNNKRNKYNALGFVEALISIIIVGVSSVVLMRIAASALIDAVQNDKIDKATQYAVEGGNIVKELYEKQDAVGWGDASSIFPPREDLTDISLCYIILGSHINPNNPKPQTFSFPISGLTFRFVTCKDPSLFSSSEIRNSCKSNYHDWNINKQYPFFRLACMKKEEDYIRVKIVVGELNYDGKVTKSTNIKDYVYETTIPIKENE